MKKIEKTNTKMLHNQSAGKDLGSLIILTLIILFTGGFLLV